jgi:GT2 family glycosyltransferase
METLGNWSTPEVSVVIPSRNRRPDLARCLAALAAQDFPKDKFEVIICDDGSTESLVEAVKDAKRAGLQARYVRQEPKGPAAARNLGIHNARARIVAMTDSDTLPEKKWLRKLYEALDRNPDAAGVEGQVFAENEAEFGPLGEGPANKSGGVYLTCNCAYRRDALVAVGGFDESFPYPAYEDTELAARILQVGRIAWQPEAIVIHPQRPLTLKAVLKKLRHWEYVMLMGYRYGYLAWPRYPVSYPRLRVVALSIAALPLSKFKTAAQWMAIKPAIALKLLLYGIAESLGALLWVTPRVLLTSFQNRIIRRRYLDAD